MAVAMTMGAFIPRFASPRSPTSSLTTTVAAPSAQFLGGNGTSRRRIVAGCRGPSLLRALSGAQGIPHALVRIVAIVGEGCISPLKDASWEEVMLHTANRLKWVDEEFQMLVFTDQSILSKDTNLQNIQKELVSANFLVNVALRNQEAIDWIKVNSEHIPNVICFESSSALEYKLGGFIIPRKSEENVFGKLVDIANSKSKKESLQVVKTVADAWGRHNSDDIRKALQCLNACSPTDQVCNYRCIASYESEYLEAFSLCVLEKNNCLELDAEIPSKPFVAPLSAFRGEALSHEVAEDLFVGWLGELDWSWRVVAGQNPAYDQFPCQFQLFYRGKSRNAFWYEPVFQVRTLEGKLVWRRRRYRVVRATVPGTFFFSVLDNGVVSKEFWTIVDVCNDFSWGLFHYSGAARAAGQAYTGAVLVSPDGMYPPDMGGQRLISALEKCSIKEWELFDVDNSSCSSPPLGIPQGSRLHAKIDVKHQKSTYDQRM
ncbi:uncharacterized protein LOC120253052 isoform X2 [Dioscorea cayenensis subsp. rotundata]|uniref:Uncharacterized protein LOC120253052 isoform X2 n=1 Tax=Dioscorea cayennensis subsp. rotundata TaxID=55577 RepID=A0AB40AQ92_DIOCR|nr:uncharacterized protein LOC120253052 isoform X2 [Dioscorea cayenensis subsp. rotundata]